MFRIWINKILCRLKCFFKKKWFWDNIFLARDGTTNTGTGLLHTRLHTRPGRGLLITGSLPCSTGVIFWAVWNYLDLAVLWFWFSFFPIAWEPAVLFFWLVFFLSNVQELIIFKNNQKTTVGPPTILRTMSGKMEIKGANWEPPLGTTWSHWWMMTQNELHRLLASSGCLENLSLKHPFLFFFFLD
jgi:hypothetical protein